MVLLAAFAFVAGAGTALSPCVLPILPAVLSAGITGGRRRPLGVVTGLALTHAFAIVGLVYVIDALGLPGDFVRTLAIAILLAFGLALLVPPLSARIEAWLSRLAPVPQNRRGGFGSGLLLGASLGFVYAPCAGPILAGVITVSASQPFTAGKLVVALAYAAGSAAVLYMLLAGGRRLTSRLAPFRGRIQLAVGALMVMVAGLMLADLDLRFQRAVAENLPAFLRNPASALEESEAVEDRLAAVRSSPHGAVEAGAAEAEQGMKLPVLGRAPEIVSAGQWFNSGGEALSLAGLRARGQVVLIDFWTYTCINCIRTLPYLRAWDEQYTDQGLTVLGVHTPEFPFERDPANVAQAIADYDIDYPVVQDNDYGTWNAFGNRYWPAKYLIDADGNVRYVHFGEGAYETTERAIRSLLAEAGRDRLGEAAQVSAETPDPRTRTPETYLGSARARGFVNGPIRPGPKEFASPDPAELRLNELAYGGAWEISPGSATALGAATIELRFQARRIFLVLGSARPQREVKVALDGRPIPGRLAGTDVAAGAARVGEHRLYRLVDLPRAGEHILRLRFEPGIRGYAFTFG